VLYQTKRSNRAWKPIDTAPTDKDVELQASDNFGPYTLTFPCRRRDGSWVNSRSLGAIEVQPTHWRECR